MSNDLPSLTTADVTRIANVSIRTVRRWIKTGELKCVKVGGRIRTTSEWVSGIAKSIDPPIEKKAKRRVAKTEKERSNADVAKYLAAVRGNKKRANVFGAPLWKEGVVPGSLQRVLDGNAAKR